MGTGVYHEIIPGMPEELTQPQIDYWCQMCQFPIEKGRCQTKELIQKCWNEVGSIAAVWHRLHECPSVHQNKPCHCNDFKNMKEAFAAAGIYYDG